MADETGLVRRFQAGDAAALESLYDRYAGVIFSVALRALGPDGAEEVVQEAFVRLWRNAGGYDPARGSFDRWLFAIARNCVIDELRRRRGGPRWVDGDDVELILAALPDRDPGPEELAWQRDQARALARALGGLPPEQRQVLALAYYGGYSQSEIARGLGIPLGTVKKRVKLGMQKLRAALTGAHSLERA